MLSAPSGLPGKGSSVGYGPSFRVRSTLEGFAEKMLRVSYRGEIRPEAPERVLEVFKAQKETLEGIARESLEAAEKRGEVIEESGMYRWARPPGKGAWAFTTLYFGISKARATTRWFKYMITFDGWLDYIQRKIERRAGFEVRSTRGSVGGP